MLRALLVGGALVAGLLWHGMIPMPYAEAIAVKPGQFIEQSDRLEIPVGRYLKRDARAAFGFPENSLNLNHISLVYRTYRPANPRKDAPTLVLLHGSGRDGTILLAKWREIAKREGLFLIAPQSPNLRRWSQREVDAETLVDLVDHARKQALLDTGPLFLFGHSAGGVLATRLAVTDPGRFAAIVTHAGFAGEISLQPGAQALSGRREASPVPVALMLGDQDKIFSVPAARSSGAALVGLGHDVKLIVFEEHSHWYYTAAPSINRRAWAFLRKHL